MKTTEKTFTVQELVADEGKVIQNKANPYLYGKIIHIGLNDSPDNWQEIDEADIPVKEEPEMNLPE